MVPLAEMQHGLIFLAHFLFLLFFDKKAPLLAEEAENVRVDIDPKSDRLQLMETFDSWQGHDYIELPLLIKVKVDLLLLFFILDSLV